MATSTDPLRRSAIEVVARLPGASLQAPTTNAALQLADSLANITPEAQRAMQGIAQNRAEEARAQATKDALSANGQALADAVREGKLKPTQNPWYVQAYNREASALTADRSLTQLQIQAQSWEEYNDPEAFNARWREEVGNIAQAYSGKDQIAGFTAAEGRISSQVLQENTAKNSARIITERKANLGTLAAVALADARRANGGRLSPNQAFDALQAAREQWFATGGDEQGWQGRGGIVYNAIVTAARDSKDPGLMGLLQAPELIYGKSEAGNSAYGFGQSHEVPSTQLVPVDPEQAGGTDGVVPSTSGRVKVSSAPTRLAAPLKGNFPVTSGFGARKRPTAGASTNHGGIDYAAPAGTPVQAQAVGKVVFAGKKGGYGNAVQVDYGNGVVATYGHLSEINVKEGTVLSAGQAVGKVGRTGVATGNHLHYRLDVNGKAVDPAKFNGTVSGEFETEQTVTNPVVAFPGQDQPYSASAGTGAPEPTPANQYASGPSLYNQPGVAGDADTERYYIQQSALSAIRDRVQVLQAQRQSRGLEAADYLYSKYGLGVVNGDVTRSQIQQELSNLGFSVPEINEAVRQVGSDIRDNVAVAQAQVASRAADPGVATKILDLSTRAQRGGLTTGLQSEVNSMIVGGYLDLDSARGIVNSAIGTTERQESIARSDAKEDERLARTEKAQGEVNSAAKLNNFTRGTAARLFQVIQSQRLLPSYKTRKSDELIDHYATFLQNAALAHLSAHPGDWDGAQRAADAVAANLLKQLRGNANPKPQQ